MKIELKPVGEKNWMWRAKRGGHTTEWAGGLNTKAGAIRAAEGACFAWSRLGLGRPLNREEKAAARERVRKACVVVEG